jgi:hypothetical protein
VKYIFKGARILFSRFLALSVILLLLSTLSCYSWSVSESRLKSKFEKEIKEDPRIVTLLSFKRTFDFWDKDIFHIGIELEDGKKFVFRARQEFNNIQGIIEFDDYNVWTLELLKVRHLWYMEGIHFTDGIQRWLLEIMLDKPNGYFKTLDGYIDSYDEIKLILERIYNEERILGNREDVGSYEKIEGNKNSVWIGNTDKWGDEEELINYSGYIFTSETDRAKIYVEKIER